MGVGAEASTRAQAAPLGLLASSVYRSTAAIRGSSNAVVAVLLIQLPSPLQLSSLPWLQELP